MNNNTNLPLYDDDNLIINEDSIPPEYSSSFQTKFSYIKKKLKMKKSRKSNIDSILKKCKGKFFKVIHESIKLCLNLLIQRLPQSFIKNITIKLNQQILNKKILDIYHEFNLLPSLNDLISKNLIRKGKMDVFNEIISYELKELYEIYISSEKYKADSLNIFKKEGKKFAILYNYVSKNFVTYYIHCKPHNKRFIKNNENDHNSNVKILCSNENNNNFICENNPDNIKYKKNIFNI